MVKYVYNEDGEIIGQYPEQQTQSIFKRLISGAGQDIKGFHQYMLRKRDEASKRNAMLNKYYKLRHRFKRKPMPDYNVCHAHNKVRVGW